MNFTGINVYGNRLYDLLKEKNISQKQLADKLGCTSAYVSRLISEDITFTYNVMEKLANVLDVDPEYFRTGEQDVSIDKKIDTLFHDYNFSYSNKIKIYNSALELKRRQQFKESKQEIEKNE